MNDINKLEKNKMPRNKVFLAVGGITLFALLFVFFMWLFDPLFTLYTSDINIALEDERVRHARS